MKRNIIKIDSDLCNGCGLCVGACHEGALVLENGKAVLVSESYCDGLGACLPECPTGAIKIEEREADPFDEKAVAQKALKENSSKDMPCGCPGTHARSINHKEKQKVESDTTTSAESELSQWPVKIKLVSVDAPYLDNAKLLVAADCTAYAYAGIHKDFIRGKITLIGCPKLDETDYAIKLTEIMKRHELKSITVLRMEVPCCGGIVNAVKTAMVNSGKLIPWSVITIGTDGSVIE